jgi:hypothetical protein
MPETEIANLVQSFGQDVLQEAAHELRALEGAGAPTPGLAVLGAKADGALVEADDAGVGNRNAEDVPGKVSEDCVFALAPADDFDDPGFRARPKITKSLASWPSGAHVV